MRIVVCGAGGFIGHHLVKRLKADGHWVRGVDLKYPEFEESAADSFEILDLRDPDRAYRAVRMADTVYQLAADMGGIGFITANHADVSRHNVQINVNVLEAARRSPNCRRYLYTSSACVYPTNVQRTEHATKLSEDMAWPALPEEGYGLEKLFSEKLCEYYRSDYGLTATAVRLHNVYGPLGTWQGGREKAPAAICRKVAEGGDLILWGDGRQTRSFMYVDDCVEGLVRLCELAPTFPVNLGTEELVTVNELAQQVLQVSGRHGVQIKHDLSKPQGVRGRNSDNETLRSLLEWEPRTTLLEGLEKTYPWIASQLEKARAA